MKYKSYFKLLTELRLTREVGLSQRKMSIWCTFVHASLYKRREENKLDAIECFIALIICSTCFGHLYAHHQELETMLVLLPHMVCNALIGGGRPSGTGQQAMCPSSFPHPGHIACCPVPDRRPPATTTLHTICGNNTSIVSSSWWWTYKCPKHVEQITSAVNHSVASSWFFSLRLKITTLFFDALHILWTSVTKLVNLFELQWLQNNLRKINILYHRGVMYSSLIFASSTKVWKLYKFPHRHEVWWEYCSAHDSSLLLK